MPLRVTTSWCSMLRIPLRTGLHTGGKQYYFTHHQTYHQRCHFAAIAGVIKQNSVIPQRRSIQNLATPSESKPTEKIIYGVEEDPDELLLQADATTIASIGKDLPSDSSSVGGSSGSHATPGAVGISKASLSQKQATFVDKTISSTLSTSAIASGTVEATTNMQHQRKRSHGEPPRRTLQETTQLPQLKLNGLAPNFHALSSHGPIDLYEYISTSSSDSNSAGAAAEVDPAIGQLQDKSSGNWLVFFSHPMDFTPVCTTEIASMAKLQDEFAKRGTKLLGLSIGSVEQHRKWMADVKKVVDAGGLRPGGGTMTPGKINQISEEDPIVHSVASNISGGDPAVLSLGNRRPGSGIRGRGEESGGVGALDEEKELGMEDVVGSGSIQITDNTPQPLSGNAITDENSLLRFPIIADEDGFVAQLFGMLEDSNGANAVGSQAGERRSEHLRTVRSLFIIDPQKRIRLMTSYPHTTGRNAAEILRVLDALQRSDHEGVLTQEGWTAGDEVIIPPEMSIEEAERRFGKDGIRTVNEYLRFAQPVLQR